MCKNRKIALIYRIAAFVICLFSILYRMDIFAGKFYSIPLLYYTIQIGLLDVILFGMLACKTLQAIKKKDCTVGYFPRLSALALLCSMVVFLVFWFVLVPSASSNVQDIDFILSYKNIGIHLVIPVLVLLDYILFSQKGKLTKRDPWIFLIPLVVYFVQATILGFAGVNYRQTDINAGSEPLNFPYFFMDYYKTGWLVALYVPLITLFCLGMGYLLWFIDKRRNLRHARQSER